MDKFPLVDNREPAEDFGTDGVFDALSPSMSLTRVQILTPQITSVTMGKAFHLSGSPHFLHFQNGIFFSNNS